ncbi:cytochrome c [Photobacterium aphoticum]|uniref:cytochrome c n=1 Tax=Photobacterium aphoticum TaxID=754436 RepID=UPI0009E2285A|nr:cytochrome c [Photobacterium aphoticum]PSU59587.1 hypothetical protein C9I90_03735 [Photobacterium aphoticum]GHA39520.1 hypothetical protein GCM10007086_11120 [Photobacterium aphoticum]
MNKKRVKKQVVNKGASERTTRLCASLIGMSMLSFTTVSWAAETIHHHEVNVEQAIEQRQAAFSDIDSTTRSVARALKQDDVDWVWVSEKADELQQHSQRLSGLFPLGSAEGSKTKEKVWDNKHQGAFHTGLAHMDAGFVALYHAAQKQNRQAALQGVEEAQSTCKGCHRQFRALW